MDMKTDKKSHVIIADDDPGIREMVSNYFEERSLSTVTVSDERMLRSLLTHQKPRLILLDLQLGNADGYQLLRTIRSSSDVPIIVITGRHVQEIDRIAGLDGGADDYVIKPFGLGELWARARAVLRRREVMENPQVPHPPARGYRFAGWVLSGKNRILTGTTQPNVELTRAEYDLMTAFLESPLQPLSREYLVGATRHHDHDVFDRSIDVLIMRLRRKVESGSNAPRIIVTERGVGYVLAVEVERISV
jgi:two-component system OmpR family response regulator